LQDVVDDADHALREFVAIEAFALAQEGDIVVPKAGGERCPEFSRKLLGTHGKWCPRQPSE
jgi:hypothetical protein